MRRLLIRGLVFRIKYRFRGGVNNWGRAGVGFIRIKVGII